MIKKIVNKPKLMECFIQMELPVYDIIVQPCYLYNDENIIGVSTSVEPLISRNATDDEIRKIWKIINEHVYEADYKEKRYAEYPSWGKQFDMIFHDLETYGALTQDGSFYKTIKDIKDDIPKE